MKRSTYIRSLFVAFFFCCLDSLYAKVYTIDFNRGTLSGTSINNGISSSTNPYLFCKSGAGFVTLHETLNRRSFYNDKGCGIRIGSDKENDGDGWFTLFLGDVAVYVSKIIVYASKGNTTSTLTIEGGTVFTQTISNDDLQDYSSLSPASANYVLPEVVVQQSFKILRFKAPGNGYVYLHRIDIIFSEDNLTLPAQSASTNYATFSSDKATFFPETSATVSTVSVNDGQLSVTALESQDGFGTSGYYVPANTGVLVASASSSADYYTLEGETLDALEDNMLKPASEAMTDGYTYYKLAYDNYDLKTGLGFYWGAANGGAFLCKDGTAYLAVPNGGSSSVKGFVLDEVSDEDAIKNLDADCPSKREYIYNVAGQRIGAPSQGFYIKDGRKFVGK